MMRDMNNKLNINNKDDTMIIIDILRANYKKHKLITHYFAVENGKLVEKTHVHEDIIEV